jgi:hypothetical protein
MATTTKKKDDEFSFILLGCGIFTFVLVLADFIWAKWSGMEWWVLGLVILFHALTALGWVKILGNWKDPNYDYWRKVVIVTAIAGIIVIMGHRSDWIGKQRFTAVKSVQI